MPMRRNRPRPRHSGGKGHFIRRSHGPRRIDAHALIRLDAGSAAATEPWSAAPPWRDCRPKKTGRGAAPRPSLNLAGAITQASATRCPFGLDRRRHLPPSQAAARAPCPGQRGQPALARARADHGGGRRVVILMMPFAARDPYIDSAAAPLMTSMLSIDFASRSDTLVPGARTIPSITYSGALAEISPLDVVVVLRRRIVPTRVSCVPDAAIVSPANAARRADSSVSRRETVSSTARASGTTASDRFTCVVSAAIFTNGSRNGR